MNMQGDMNPMGCESDVSSMVVSCRKGIGTQRMKRGMSDGVAHARHTKMRMAGEVADTRGGACCGVTMGMMADEAVDKRGVVHPAA
jgi:hypothetical protein